MEDEEWRRKNFRRKLVSQIEEAMRKAGVARKKTSEEMENEAYVKANSREEYLVLVARLIIHFREIQKEKSEAAAALGARLPAKRARQPEEEEEEEGPAASEPPPAEEEIPLARGGQPEPQPTRRAAAGGGESNACGRDSPVSVREVIEYLQSMKDEIITALAAFDARLKAIEDRVKQHTE